MTRLWLAVYRGFRPFSGAGYRKSLIVGPIVNVFLTRFYQYKHQCSASLGGNYIASEIWSASFISPISLSSHTTSTRFPTGTVLVLPTLFQVCTVPPVDVTQLLIVWVRLSSDAGTLGRSHGCRT